MATVEASGPFSVFPGVDRTLSILEGEGILLSVEGRIPVGLTSRSGPLTFPADVATSAALIAGQITDLNVMTRRGRYRHKVSTHELKGSTVISFAGAEALLFCQAGSMLANGDGQPVTLGRFDAAIPGSAALRLEGSAKFFAVEFHEI
jgi:environmental stress-induced protein Ves